MVFGLKPIKRCAAQENTQDCFELGASAEGLFIHIGRCEIEGQLGRIDLVGDVIFRRPGASNTRVFFVGGVLFHLGHLRGLRVTPCDKLVAVNHGATCRQANHFREVVTLFCPAPECCNTDAEIGSGLLWTVTF